MDWSDKRPIKELRFGAEWKPTLGDLMAQRTPPEDLEPRALARWKELPDEAVVSAWIKTHSDKIERVGIIGVKCGCETAEDIAALGCTGVIARGCTIDDAKFFRMGLGGTGVGLPCFVPPSRYCLVHEVTGGLQDGQEQRYSEQVAAISRELTPEEQAQGHLVQAAQRVRGDDRVGGALELLSGHALPEGWKPEDVDVEAAEAIRLPLGVETIPHASIPYAWTCPEHKTRNWKCRYCVAQAIVEGALEPQYLTAISNSAVGTEHDMPSASTLEAYIATCDKDDIDEIKIYALVKTLTRRLA